MDLGIAGRTAIICASSRGLGRGCAEALAAAGCRVVINGRDEAQLEKTADAIRKASGAEVVPVKADVSTAEGQKALLDAAGPVDILVNNNGGPPFRDYSEIDRAAMIAGITNNMIVPIELVQAVMPGMIERRWGRIVNITSGSVKSPLPGLDLSSGARIGLTGFLAGVARQVSRHNVTINAVLPGPFDTDRLRSGMENAAKKRGLPLEQVVEERRSENPAKRFGTPEEFGAACAFLCSDKAGFITGQSLLLDGGAFPGVL